MILCAFRVQPETGRCISILVFALEGNGATKAFAPMISQIQKVDPKLLARCTDAISEVHQRDPEGFDADYVNIMSATVMFVVGGDRDIALAILFRISRLVGCIWDEPRIGDLFGPNQTNIPHPLAYSAAVAPLEQNGDFDPSVIEQMAMLFTEARGRA